MHPSGRTSFPEAVKAILDTLEKGGDFSISGLAQATNLNRRTVQKAVALIEEVQRILLERRLEVTELHGAKVVQTKKNLGLLSVPEQIQNLIIRTAFFPTPSREEEILVYAFLKKAISADTAIRKDRSPLIRKLLKQGQLGETEDGRIYLSEEGLFIAKGALSLYPELYNVGTSSRVKVKVRMRTTDLEIEGGSSGEIVDKLITLGRKYNLSLISPQTNEGIETVLK